MSEPAIKCTVEGRVQGVFYRARTVERATELGVNGWVRNLTNGRVELAVSGDAVAVDELIAWLWQGPRSARVTAVSVEEWPDAIEPGFRIVD